MDSFRIMENNIQKYPDAWQVYHDIGYPYQMMKQYENAIEAYQKAEALHPGNVARLRNLARMSLKIHKPLQAIDFCQSGLSYEPGDPWLKSSLIKGLLWAGRENEARTLYKNNRDIVIKGNNFQSVIENDLTALEEKGHHIDGVDTFRQFMIGQEPKE